MGRKEMRGKFVTVEGCEGSGKSTQLKMLAEYLTSAGIDFIMTREPGGSEISEDIRKIILNGKYKQMCDECEALLYAAARVQHIKEVIEPALESGKLVICDRYVDSSFAYQGYARELGEQYIAEINNIALERFSPDLTLFLDISPRDAFLRKHGADEGDRIESMGIEFHEKVYAGYRALLQKYPRICAVECGGTKFQTAENIKRILKEKNII